MSAMTRTMTSDQVRTMLRLAINGNASAWAKERGMSPAYVSDILRGSREPAGKVLDALGVERVVTYRKVAA